MWRSRISIIEGSSKKAPVEVGLEFGVDNENDRKECGDSVALQTLLQGWAGESGRSGGAHKAGGADKVGAVHGKAARGKAHPTSVM